MPKTSKKREYKTVKGMHDILPQEQPLWERIVKVGKDTADFYNFQPLTTPIVEPLELYQKTTGEESDIVQKEMFILKGKEGGGQLALRPEFTPSIARAYLQHGFTHQPHPVKFFSFGPVFRHENPQAGRLRQFHQLNAEIFSAENDPVYDAQAILFGYRILEELKVKGVMIQINSIGCRTCRPNYKKALTNYYKPLEKQLCADCKRRLGTNPLRLLDCKVEKCVALKEEAPITLEHLCAQCKSHFTEVLEYLENLGLPYTLTHTLVRGLDYYTKTVFEFVVEPEAGEEKIPTFALGGGGRYDYLLESMGAKSMPAVGVSLGVERILLTLKERGVNIAPRPKEKVFLIHIGELAKKKSLGLIEELKRNKIPVAESLGKDSLGAQLKIADKLGSTIALIFGQKEAHEESIIIRDMKTGAQETIPLPKLVVAIKKRL